MANARDLPIYDEADLRRAIRAEEGGVGLASEEEARRCLPAVVGERFQIRYQGADVQQFAIDLSAPQPALAPDCDKALLCKSLPGARGKRIAVFMPVSNGTRQFGDAPPESLLHQREALIPQDIFGMQDGAHIVDDADSANDNGTQASAGQADSYDLVLFVADQDSGELYNRYLEKRAYVSAPLILNKFALDSGRYYLAPDVRAFGLRAEYANPSTFTPQGETTLKLFVPHGNTLRLALDGLVVNKTSSQWSGACLGSSTDLSRVIEIGDVTHDGYADLVVRTTRRTTQSKMDGAKCVQTPLPPSTEIVTLPYDGRKYVIPAALRAAQ